jgi:hypothetical protein
MSSPKKRSSILMLDLFPGSFIVSDMDEVSTPVLYFEKSIGIRKKFKGKINDKTMDVSK